MQREIKFRVWDIQEKCWSTKMYTDIIKPLPNDPELFIGISQFTGLYDRLGNEIWEGDIIEINYYKINIPWWKDLKHKMEIDVKAKKDRDNYSTVILPIVFHDGQFVAKNDYLIFDSQNLRFLGHTKFEKTHWCDAEEKSWGYTVVGNIYENPELVQN